MVEVDCFLTEEDKRDLEIARQEYEWGETTSLEDFETEMEKAYKDRQKVKSL